MSTEPEGDVYYREKAASTMTREELIEALKEAVTMLHNMMEATAGYRKRLERWGINELGDKQN